MTADKIEWDQFCDRGAAMMRGVLEDKFTLRESGDFFESDKSISDAELRDYVNYIIYEFGGSPGYYREVIQLFESHATEEEMLQYFKTPDPISSVYGWFRDLFRR